MSAYDFLANFYDTFQQELEPEAWVQFVDALVKKHGAFPGDGENGKPLLCDLGCGTGAVTCLFAKNGYDIIGVDNSLPMLDQARARAEEEGVQALWLCQDMAALDLYGTMDVFVSLLDTVNHITCKEDLKKLLKSFFCFLNPGGLFIFDVATEKHFQKSLGNDFFYSIEDDFAVLWENSYSSRTKKNIAGLTMFSRVNGETYEREDAEICERFYPDAEIRELVKKCGLEVVGVYGDLKMRRPNDKDERVFYVIQRPVC